MEDSRVRQGWRREKMSAQEERTRWKRLQRQRAKALGELEGRTKREWSALYGRQEREQPTATA